MGFRRKGKRLSTSVLHIPSQRSFSIFAVVGHKAQRHFIQALCMHACSKKKDIEHCSKIVKIKKDRRNE